MYSRGLYYDTLAGTSAVTITNRAREIHDEIQDAIKFVRRKTIGDIGLQACFVLCYMLVYRKVGAKADRFFDSFLDGAGSEWWVGSPAYALRKRFLQDRQDGARKTHSEKIEHILRAWNFHVQGKKKVASISTLKSFPKIEG